MSESINFALPLSGAVIVPIGRFGDLTWINAVSGGRFVTQCNNAAGRKAAIQERRFLTLRTYNRMVQ
jgi:hypothetical protein